MLVATRLDRWGRSVRDLLSVAEEFRQRGVQVRCLDQPINTVTPEGKLFFTILAAFAEFERDLLVSRTREGLAATQNRGHGGGRKPKLQPYQVEWARQQIDAGRTVTEVAAELGEGIDGGLSRMALYRALNGTNRPQPPAPPAKKKPKPGKQ